MYTDINTSGRSHSKLLNEYSPKKGLIWNYRCSHFTLCIFVIISLYWGVLKKNIKNPCSLSSDQIYLKKRTLFLLVTGACNLKLMFCEKYTREMWKRGVARYIQNTNSGMTDKKLGGKLVRNLKMDATDSKHPNWSLPNQQQWKQPAVTCIPTSHNEYIFKY